MTSTAAISGFTSSAPPAPVPPAPAATASSAVNQKPLTQTSDTSISPRIVVDPLAGVITQFLSSTGVVQDQIPSQTVVAYLRAGLTPDGLSKPNPDSVA